MMWRKDVDSEPITMQLPYVSGFLAYREAGFLLSKLSKLKSTSPHLYPHCLLVDGNGLLQKNCFGMACHIGLASDTPTIGVSKKLIHARGLENNAEHKARIKSELLKAGDCFELHDQTGSGELIGLCYRAADNAPNPIYVSVGNKMSWDTCRWLLPLVITKYRIPEPIRMADFHTREFIRALLAPPKQAKK